MKENKLNDNKFSEDEIDIVIKAFDNYPLPTNSIYLPYTIKQINEILVKLQLRGIISKITSGRVEEIEIAGKNTQIELYPTFSLTEDVVSFLMQSEPQEKVHTFLKKRLDDEYKHYMEDFEEKKSNHSKYERYTTLCGIGICSIGIFLLVFFGFTITGVYFGKWGILLSLLLLTFLLWLFRHLSNKGKEFEITLKEDIMLNISKIAHYLELYTQNPLEKVSLRCAKNVLEYLKPTLLKSILNPNLDIFISRGFEKDAEGVKFFELLGYSLKYFKQKMNTTKASDLTPIVYQLRKLVNYISTENFKSGIKFLEKDLNIKKDKALIEKIFIKFNRDKIKDTTYILIWIIFILLFISNKIGIIDTSIKPSPIVWLASASTIITAFILLKKYYDKVYIQAEKIILYQKEK